MESESIRSIDSESKIDKCEIINFHDSTGLSGHCMRLTCTKWLCLLQFIATIVMIVIFVLLVVAISSPNSTGKDPDTHFHSPEIEIGDILGNSSLLIPTSSQTSSTVTFHSNKEPFTILLSDRIPSTITDYLPLQQLPLLSGQSESVYRGDFNYFGSDEPIYLLSGSFIEYNLTLTLIKSINTVYPACLYLFTNETHYENFLMPIQNNYQYNDSCCFFYVRSDTWNSCDCFAFLRN